MYHYLGLGAARADNNSWPLAIFCAISYKMATQNSIMIASNCADGQSKFSVWPAKPKAFFQLWVPLPGLKPRSQAQVSSPGLKPRSQTQVSSPGLKPWSQVQVLSPGLKPRSQAPVSSPGLKLRSQAQVSSPGLKPRSQAQVSSPGLQTYPADTPQDTPPTPTCTSNTFLPSCP